MNEKVPNGSRANGNTVPLRVKMKKVRRKSTNTGKGNEKFIFMLPVVYPLLHQKSVKIMIMDKIFIFISDLKS